MCATFGGGGGGGWRRGEHVETPPPPVLKSPLQQRAKGNGSARDPGRRPLTPPRDQIPRGSFVTFSDDRVTHNSTPRSNPAWYTVGSHFLFAVVFILLVSGIHLQAEWVTKMIRR